MIRHILPNPKWGFIGLGVLFALFLAVFFTGHYAVDELKASGSREEVLAKQLGQCVAELTVIKGEQGQLIRGAEDEVEIRDYDGADTLRRLCDNGWTTDKSRCP